MIELKKYNFITGTLSDVSHATSRIIKFLELEGRNILLLHSDRFNKSTNIKYFYDNKIEFNSFEEFSDLLVGGNIFRIDTLVLDFWHLEVDQVMRYKQELDKLNNIQFIILARRFHYKTSDDVNDYHIKTDVSEFSFDYPMEYIITENISGWSSTISNLATAYIRDKKIQQIFKKDDNC